MKLFTLPMVLLAWCALAGCATNPAVSAKKAGMRTVNVEARVDARQGMRYGFDLNNGAGGLANALASMIVDSAGQKGITRMSAVMATNGIIVPELVRERLTEHLRGNKELEFSEKEPDGVFIATILQYGFDAPNLKFSSKCPIIQLRVELRNRSGKKIWSRQSTAFQLTSKDIGATWDQYEAQPEKLRADWVTQIDHVVTRLIATD